MTTATAGTRNGLTPGFYLLTLLLAFASTAELRVRGGGGPSFTLLEVVAYPVGLCLLAEALLRPALAAELGNLHRRNRFVVWYAAAAGVASFAGLLRSVDALQAYKDIVPAFAVYVLVYLTVDGRERLIGLFVASLAGVIANVGLGLLQGATGGPRVVPAAETVEAKLDMAGEVAERVPTGLLAHPNGLALFLLPATLFLIVATWPGFGRTRRLDVGMLGITAAAVLVFKLTFAKGAQAWLAAGLFFLAVPRRFDRFRFPLAVTTVLVGVAALLGLSIHAVMDGQSQYGTVLGRLALWLGCVQILSDDVVVAAMGNGAPQLQAMDLNFSDAHSAWLNQALTYGLPVLVLYLGIFASALRSLSRVITTGRPAVRTIALATMTSIMVVAGDSFFEPSDRSVVLQSQLFLLFGLAAVLRREAEQPLLATELP